MYEEETPFKLRIAGGLTSAINNAMEAKRKSLAVPFSKFLAITNSDNGMISFSRCVACSFILAPIGSS